MFSSPAACWLPRTVMAREQSVKWGKLLSLYYCRSNEQCTAIEKPAGIALIMRISWTATTKGLCPLWGRSSAQVFEVSGQWQRSCETCPASAVIEMYYRATRESPDWKGKETERNFGLVLKLAIDIPMIMARGKIRLSRIELFIARITIRESTYSSTGTCCNWSIDRDTSLRVYSYCNAIHDSGEMLGSSYDGMEMSPLSVILLVTVPIQE